MGIGINLIQMTQSERIEIALVAGGGFLVFFIINKIKDKQRQKKT